MRDFGAAKWFARFMKLIPGAVETDPESGKSVPAANSVARWADDNNVHPKAAEALHRRLKNLIYDKPYVVERPAAESCPFSLETFGRPVTCPKRCLTSWPWSAGPTTVTRS